MTNEPTAAQSDQCMIVQHDIVELINRLAIEGFDYRVIMAGISAATVAAVSNFVSEKEVPVWFARQAALTYHMAKLAED